MLLQLCTHVFRCLRGDEMIKTSCTPWNINGWKFNKIEVDGRWVSFSIGWFLRSTYYFYLFFLRSTYYFLRCCVLVSLIPNLQGQETMLRPARRAAKGSFFLFNMSQHQTSESSPIFSRVIPGTPKGMGPLYGFYGKFPILFLYLLRILPPIFRVNHYQLPGSFTNLGKTPAASDGYISWYLNSRNPKDPFVPPKKILKSPQIVPWNRAFQAATSIHEIHLYVYIHTYIYIYIYTYYIYTWNPFIYVFLPPKAGLDPGYIRDIDIKNIFQYK